MDRCVGKTEEHGDAEGDDETEPDGEDAHHGEVGAVLNEVPLAEHEHCVGEHEGVSAHHADAVDDDACGGDVSEAAGHVDVQLVPVTLLFDVVSQVQQHVDQL